MIIPLPGLSRIYSILLQEEGQRALNSGTIIPSESIAMATNNSYTPSKPPAYSNSFQDRKRLCSNAKHCGFNGHTIDRCFQLIGYPPNWKVPKGQRKAISDTPSQMISQPAYQANSVALVPDTSSDTTTPIPDFFNPDMYQKYIEFVKNQSSVNLSSPCCCC